MLRLGPHFDPPLGDIPARLEQVGLATFQTTLRDPHRLSKESVPDDDDQAAYRSAALGAGGGLWGMAHASLLTNLAAPDARVRHGSVGALAADANLAASLGLAGVCFHVGYQKGHARREDALETVASKLLDVLAKLKPGAQVWLENGCEGTELGQSLDEVGLVAQAVGAAGIGKLGFTLDTCHLHVAGYDLAAPDAPQRLADDLDCTGLTPYLSALHLNDAREACGSHRDRHAAPGQGTIGEGLRRLMAHPRFAPLPCILEVSLADALQGIAFLTAHPDA